MFNKYSVGTIVFFMAIMVGFSPIAKGQVLAERVGGQQINIPVQSDSEKLLQKSISLHVENLQMETVLEKIQQQSGVYIFYTRNILRGVPKVTYQAKNKSLNDVMNQLFKPLGIDYWATGSYIILRKKELTPILETVSGQVTDAASGESLPGVNVMVKGTTTGTSTDNEGDYELNVPSLQDTLVVSFIGYQTKEVPINGRTELDIALQPQTIQGEELLVTGYTSQRQADIIGAVSAANVQDMKTTTGASVLSAMQGRVSGVTVETGGSPGSRNIVRIRGVSSFQNNDPLYIIDGVPVKGDYNNFLNPNDIASMQVLKDAAAASIYGARASNGVVIIETKQGQAGETQVTFDANWGVATPVNGYDDILIQNTLNYHEVVKRSHVNAGLSVPTNIYGDPNNPSVPKYIYPNDGVNQTNSLQPFGITEEDFQICSCDNLIMPGSQGTNWWDALFSPAPTQEYNLNISGGSQTATYNVSFNYFDQEGTMKYNYYERSSIRVNTQFKAGIFTFGENATFSIDQIVGGMQSGAMGEGTPVGQLIKMQPVVPVHALNGQYFGGAKANGLGNGENPVWVVWEDRNDEQESNQFMGNAFATADLYEGLQFKSSFGFNLGRNANENFSLPSYHASEPTLITSRSESFGEFTNWTWSNTLNYVNTFAQNHNVNALVGTEANRLSNRSMFGSMAGYLSKSLNVRYIQDALGDPGTKNVGSFGGFSTLLSYFGKVDYNYAQKYYLGATLRRDGSSRLGSKNRWGTFPAFSVGWRVTEESFMPESSVLTDFKLRASYGITGNQQIPTGRTVDQFGGSTGSTFYDITGSNGSIAKGFRKTAIGNDELKWEENVSYNIGLDAEFLDGRWSFVLDLYRREVNDLLFNPKIPATQGNAAPPWQNVGKMRNEGIDFSLGYRGNLGTDLSFRVDVNGSYYKNEIVRIAGDQDFFYGFSRGRGSNNTINRLGNPVGAFYGYVADGIFANQQEVDAHVDQDGAAPGRLRFKDVNGDGQITAQDKDIIGSYHPDFTGGLNLGLQWKNFDFNAFLYASVGNDIFNITREFTIFRLFSTNVRQDVLTKSAVVENGQVVNMDEAEYPRLDQNDNFSSAYSSFYVEDGSYLRLQNLQIGYNIPTNFLQGLSNMRVFLQGQNLFTVTGYSGLDPSMPAGDFSGSVDATDQARGLDQGTYPSNRIISIGVNARF